MESHRYSKKRTHCVLLPIGNTYRVCASGIGSRVCGGWKVLPNSPLRFPSVHFPRPALLSQYLNTQVHPSSPLMGKCIFGHSQPAALPTSVAETSRSLIRNLRLPFSAVAFTLPHSPSPTTTRASPPTTVSIKTLLTSHLAPTLSSTIRLGALNTDTNILVSQLSIALPRDTSWTCH